jgi:MFS family permease
MRRLHDGWIMVTLATLVVFVALGCGRFGYSILLPTMQTALAMDNTQAGALASVNLAAYLLSSLAAGFLASHGGPRRVIAWGLALASLGMILTGLSGRFLDAATWRALTGIGSGAANVPVMGLLSAWSAPAYRGRVTGIAVTGSSLALMLLGPGIPSLIRTYGAEGWRWSWMLMGTLGGLIAIAASLFLRNQPAEKGLVPLGADSRVTLAPASARPRWRDVYRAGPVWYLGFVYVAYGFSYIIYMTFFVKHLVAEGGYSREGAGQLFMTMGVFSLFCGLIWGTLSDRVGRHNTLVGIYLVHALAFALFGFATSPVCFVLSAILFGLSAWSIPAIMAAACGDVVGPVLAPAALGFVTLFFGVGQAVGPGVAGWMADQTGSLGSAFLLASGVACAGAIGSMGLRGMGRR